MSHAMTLTQLNCEGGFARSPEDMSLCLCVHMWFLFKFMKHVIPAWIMFNDFFFC